MQLNALPDNRYDAQEAEAELLDRIENYWDNRSTDFSAKRRQELAGPNANAWLRLIRAQLPDNLPQPLQVLDIGTGAGFFPILLTQAALAEHTIGIDMSSDMLREAKENTLATGTHSRIEFRQMNAQELDFADESFDLILTRNLTWTLPDAMQAYREWHRVLRRGGLLMNFDADRGQEIFSKDADNPENVHACISNAQLDECNAIKSALRISTHRRPVWDCAFLRELGFHVASEPDISARVFLDPELAYDDEELFAIYAQKLR